MNDDADRAAEVALAASRGTHYGTAEISPEGIDRSQLRRNLLLSPEERLEQMVRAVRILQSLQGTVPRAKDQAKLAELLALRELIEEEGRL